MSALSSFLKGGSAKPSDLYQAAIKGGATNPADLYQAALKGGATKPSGQQREPVKVGNLDSNLNWNFMRVGIFCNCTRYHIRG